MYLRYIFAGFLLVGSFAASIIETWAGAGNLTSSCKREQVLIPHVCQGGANAGLACSVFGSLAEPCVVSDQGDCGIGGECVIDYSSSKKILVHVSLMLDDDATVNQQRVVNRALTLLLCATYKGAQHCFSETYLGNPANNDSISLPPFTASDGEALWSGWYGNLTPNKQRTKVVENFKFSAPEGLLPVNPEGDLAQGLRDVFQVTGLPIITDIGSSGSVHFDDHLNDSTGSVLRFDATLRFIDK